MTTFKIHPSSKAGLPSPDSYVVTRKNMSFLRLLGQQPAWELMTATASEDNGPIRVCPERRRLIEAALRTSIELGGTQPKVEVDWLGREYAKICVVRQDPGESDELVKSQLNTVIARFFDLYDSHVAPDARGKDEMQDLYEALATDDGADVYLSDGVWLSSDGSMRDDGR
ncbi:hypothetical protein [Variovorax sp.]|jgi:hypothetical protein|uniref:hypothetical protein n=1 Tax=Variovorax sp. TaxID=1871043 RepID=UPI0037D991DB